jgi:AbrB family looped-hinge helix DNA binding protein
MITNTRKNPEGPDMELIKIQKKYQITLPKAVRDSFGLEIGDYIEIEKIEGKILLKPVSVIPKDQRYFHTKEWQKKEAQADEDIKEGVVSGPFDNAEDALAALND